MKKYETVEKFNLKTGENTISPVMDIDEISLSINEEPVSSDNYTVDGHDIVFNEPVEDYSFVSANGFINTNKSVLSRGKSNLPNMIFPKYSENEILKPNNRYHMEVMIDDEPVVADFFTPKSPMFATSKRLLKEIGEFIGDYSVPEIEEYLYNNSKDVVTLIDELASQEDPVTNVTYEVSGTGMYSTSDQAIKDWVLYKTCIDLIYMRYFGISANYGSIMKEVGDIKVEKSTKLPYIDNLLAKFRKLFDLADAKIRGSHLVATPVRAGTQYSYSDWERETTF